MKSKKVLITGVLGQDGANMAEYLLNKYPEIQVYGMARRSATPNHVNINEFKNNKSFHLVEGDLTDEVSINNLVKDLKPDFLVNFAANSFVGCSWNMPIQVFNVNTLGVIRCLEAIRKYNPNCRFYQASSSEEFGDVEYSPQDINHPAKARSPYGASKIASRQITKVYRESYNLYAICGVLMNHEGRKRSEEFVTRKITKSVAKIRKQILNNQEITPLELGNLDAKRDWSDSEDFVDAVWKMLNQEEFNPELKECLLSDRAEKVQQAGILIPTDYETQDRKALSKLIKDYVVASGECHSIKEFVEIAFKEAGMAGFWSGSGLGEFYTISSLKGQHSQIWLKSPIKAVKINEKYFRPAEVDLLMGDSSPIRKELGWKPNVSFEELVRKMVNHDIKCLE